jgi:transposase
LCVRWTDFSLRPCGKAIRRPGQPCHKVKGVRQLIEEAGALRYPPAYSPDLNPIEQAYGKLKAELRKAAARTFDALVEAIAQALNELCANYLANSGYRRQ